ncbi:PhzF family phenazine biosynthesis protein [Kiloniella sp. b19]|uniref:PhzF family phenazine biosynthesis protein n=1 Tax=Kiloniella sp. GXU_MW_B19 TaxID=3141326 RepID=UPI0031DAEC9E
MKHLPLFQVDAFTGRVFAGNPAAVCVVDEWLDDVVMQSIAAENNLAETAFVIPSQLKGEGKSGLRWFTPTTEVDLCGHATLATAAALMHMHPEWKDAFVFDTASGDLTVAQTEINGKAALELDFPARVPSGSDEQLDAVEQAVGLRPLSVVRAAKLMAVYDNQEQIESIVPNLDKVEALPGDGLIVTAPASKPDPDGNRLDFVSRYFGPHCGIPEDSVTGSAHVTSVPYWAEKLGKQEMVARQISRRGGTLWVRLDGDRVRMAGFAALYMEGVIRI